jgi:hypothetical protein
MLSSHLCLGLPSSFLPPVLTTKILHSPLTLLPPLGNCDVLLPFHFLDFLTRIIICEDNSLWRSLICNFLQPSLTSSFIARKLINKLNKILSIHIIMITVIILSRLWQRTWSFLKCFNFFYNFEILWGLPIVWCPTLLIEHTRKYIPLAIRAHAIWW